MHKNCTDELLFELFNELNSQFFNNKLELNNLIVRWKQDEECIDKFGWGICFGYKIIILKRFINKKDIKEEVYRSSLKKLLYHELLHFYFKETVKGHNGNFHQMENKLNILYNPDLGNMESIKNPTKLKLSEYE